MNYKIVHVGGDPTKAAFLASDLSKNVRELQADGWEIDGIDLIEHEHGWDMRKQMYVKTQEYIVRAKKETLNDYINTFCPNCGITETSPKYMQKYCRYCGHELEEE